MMAATLGLSATHGIIFKLESSAIPVACTARCCCCCCCSWIAPQWLLPAHAEQLLLLTASDLDFCNCMRNSSCHDCTPEQQSFPEEFKYLSNVF
jgi:hypothetical protein